METPFVTLNVPGPLSDSDISTDFQRDGDACAIDLQPTRGATKSLSKPKKRDGRRKTGPAPYSTALQRRKKAEIQELRQATQQLNAQLVELQQRRHDRVITATAQGSGGWRSLAAIESEERQRAERCNKQLKAIMANQGKVNASICRLLEKWNAFEGMEYLQQLQPAIDRPVVRLGTSSAFLANLATGLDSLRRDAEKMFPPPGNDLAVICRSQYRQHPTLGLPIVETTTTTSLPCTVQSAMAVLWGFVSSDIDKSFHSVDKLNPHPYEMNAVAKSRDGNLNTDGVIMYRRYDEDDRTIVVGATTWVLPSGGLQFEDRVWMVVSPSPVDPLQMCVVQTRYQLQAKILDNSVRPVDFEYAQNAVMSSIGSKLRNAMQSLQSAMLDAVGVV